jgi:gas vesicle protein
MKAMRFFEGLMLGGLVGAAVAILFAPSSGTELRGRMQGEADRVRMEVNQAAATRRMELEQQLTALRTPRK